MFTELLWSVTKKTYGGTGFSTFVLIKSLAIGGEKLCLQKDYTNFIPGYQWLNFEFCKCVQYSLSPNAAVSYEKK